MSILGMCPICQETCSLFDRLVPGTSVTREICEKCDMQLNAEAEQRESVSELTEQQQIAKQAKELEEVKELNTALICQVTNLKSIAAAVCAELPDLITRNQASLMHAVSHYGQTGTPKACLAFHDSEVAKAAYFSGFIDGYNQYSEEGPLGDTVKHARFKSEVHAAKVKAKVGAA